MHILIVLDHPNPDSFCGAVCTEFTAGAKAAGNTVEVADLHAEKFNPIWSMDDIRGEGPDGPPKDILQEQARIDRADAICLIFPLFWWGMPSMSKGWIDRVWSWGWAYDQLDDPEVSLQRPRTLRIITPAGARSDEMSERGYTKALETDWIDGTFGYFGFVNRKLEVLNGSTGSLERRQGLLKRAYKIGYDLPQAV